MDCSKEAMRTGLKTLSSNCPHAPATVTVVWFPNTCVRSRNGVAAHLEQHCQPETVSDTSDATAQASSEGGRLTWAATMVIASTCVGLTLPGMMLLPGSFSGRFSSPSPQRGPLPDCCRSHSASKTRLHFRAGLLEGDLVASALGRQR